MSWLDLFGKRKKGPMDNEPEREMLLWCIQEMPKNELMNWQVLKQG